MFTSTTEVTLKLMIKEVKELQKLAQKNRRSLERLIKNSGKNSIFKERLKKTNTESFFED